ncbi:MAG: MATE family efflux transporter [bacterium]|nr:MATE family efflux transporter [bacterium]
MATHDKENILNMTEGNTTKLLLVFALPMLIGNVFQQLYNLVDSIVVGQLVGADALAAIGATGSISFLFIALCNGIASGGGIVTSQYFGSGDTHLVKSCIVNTAYIMVVFPLVVGAAAYFLVDPILVLLETPEGIMADALTYIRVMCVGLIFVALYNYIASMLRALGDSKTPLYFLIFACVLNTVLDVIFVKYLHMSVFGAGVATLISQFVSGVLCIAYAIRKNSYFKFQKEDLRPNREVIWETIRIGVPLSLQFSMIAISCLALQRVVNTFGEIAVAAFTATSRIEQVIHQPYTTLGTAIATYSGQNFGAKKNDRVLMGYRKGMLLMVIFSLMMLPVMQFFGATIISWFVNDPEVIAMGAKALQISSPFYAVLGVIYVVRGVLNGVGDAFFALLNGIVEVIGRFTVPIALTMIPMIGVWGIWWSVGVVWFISALTAWIRYLKYKRKVLI